jgi:hypothetical protein
MQTSAYVDAIRSTPIPKPAHRLRPTEVKADSLGQLMDLMGATMAYPSILKFSVRANLRSISIR